MNNLNIDTKKSPIKKDKITNEYNTPNKLRRQGSYLNKFRLELVIENMTKSPNMTKGEIAEITNDVFYTISHFFIIIGAIL